ncbi:MAG: hypothetical protein GKS03_12055 [Alphaproteobacteria bacterium]|nr:hypothetical protein [Alphaproteobacteria bacterium]
METLDFEALFAIMGADLVKLITLAFLIERGLALIFEWSWFIWLKKKFPTLLSGTLISFLVSVFICWFYNFDIIASVMDPRAVTTIGVVITGAIVAGGSKVAIKIVQDLLKMGPGARSVDGPRVGNG